jgi:hypothetical protein
MPPRISDTQPSTQTSFEQDARAALAAVRDSFADIIDNLPERIRRASQLGRALDLDRKLAWKVTKVARTRDVFAVVEHLPGGSGSELFLKAAEKRGITPAMIQSARAALAGFERLIDTHAGDRASLEMMARAFSRDASDGAGGELAHRKSAFLGNSATWGVQARAQLSVNIIAPSSDPDRVDIALLSGLIDLRRLRPKVAWVVARMGFVSSEGKPQPPVPPDANREQRRAFADSYRIPLLSEFCSDPPPDLRASVTDNGMIEIELVEGPVGDTGSLTCIFSGEPFRAIGSRFSTPGGPGGPGGHGNPGSGDSRAHLNAHVRTPSTMLIHDLLVHQDLFGPLRPEAAVYSEVHREVRSAATRDERYRLPVTLSVQPLGRGPDVMRTLDVPRLPQMIQHICTRLGWDPQAFDAYRLQMPYPIVPSAVVMSFDLPATPANSHRSDR